MYQDVIKRLIRKLYPRGRAFKIPVGGFFDKLHNALAVVLSQAYEDSFATLYAILPDNANFTDADADDMARRLGIKFEAGVSLSDKKLALKRKYAHPGTNRPRQSRGYVELQLRAAGFDVYVYENRFLTSPWTGYTTMSPNDLLGTTISEVATFSDQVEFGTVEFGGTGFPKIVNYIEEEKDNLYVVGTNLRSTFFIAGPTITTYADVPANRKDEFRQLVLWLKPQQTIAYTFINYV